MAVRTAGDASAGGGVSHTRLRAQSRARRVSLVREQPSDAFDGSLADDKHFDAYLRHVFMPWRRSGETTIAAVATDSKDVRTAVFEAVAGDVAFEVIAKQKIVDALQERFRARLAYEAQFALDDAHPECSARRLLSRKTIAIALLSIGAAIAAAIVAPDAFQAVAFASIASIYFVNIALRYLLHVAGWPRRRTKRGRVRHRAPMSEIADEDLPTYTVLVPLFREANMMPRITGALRRLDYPAEKLDIKLILEEIDAETIAAARSLNLEDRFEILIVPDSDVRTKPRACNYALKFARGDLTVIFDAEDRPELDQLKKAVRTFRRSPHVACLQARLGYFNADRNWLSKFFAIEYAGWFAIMLPGLAQLGIPIPLGGTSNHFRTRVLREIGGWDAYNVTEDADVGLRLARRGYRAEPLASVTWEEANFCVFSWIRQRSRWIKGYVQTALVHARQPRAFARAVGWWRYLACMAFISGSVLGCLVSPMLWILSAVWWLTASGPDGFAYVILFNGSLFFGIAVITVFTMLGPIATGEDRLAIRGAGICIYWLLMSVAAYKGLFQLFNGKSSFWEKTDHGIENCRPKPRLTTLGPRLVAAHTMLALCLVGLTTYAAFGNPWPKQQGNGEVVSTLRVLKSIEGFAADAESDGALDIHAEYGLTDAVTFVMDAEAKDDGGSSGPLLEHAQAGARVSLLRWDTGVIAVQAQGGMSAIRTADESSFLSSLHASAEVRALFGQDFTLFGEHAWFASEAGYRWRPGPPADEILFDMTLGIQPRDDLFFMLQSFGVQTTGEAFAGYRSFVSEKLQVSAVYEVVPHIWLQAGAIGSVYGDDYGNAGGIVALWWRF